jgi:hypothetical protein
VHVGASAWSFSSSACGATSASGVSVSVRDAPCSNCSALTSSGLISLQANALGGSMSVIYIGASAWSFGTGASSPSSSTCGATSASVVSVSVRDAPCSNCSALTSSSSISFQANAYGGSMSVVHVGANAWSLVLYVGSPDIFSRSLCNATRATNLTVFIADSSMYLTKAFSSKCRPICV